MPVTSIVGAGGIGCTIGYEWLQSGMTVDFVEDNAEKVKNGNRFGVRLNKEPPLPARFLHFDDWSPQSGDTVLLCVKCFDNARVLEKLMKDVTILPIQNGYDEKLDRRDHHFEGIASFVAKCEPDAPHASITRIGHLHFGPRHPDLKMQFAYPPSRHVAVRIVPDIRPIKATKLMYNAAISPLAAGAGVDNGELLSDPLARKLFFALLEENYRILTAANVPLGKVGPFHPHTVSKILRTPLLARVMAKFFVNSLRGTYCSMAGDIERGRTELDNYTGYLLKLAGDTTPAPWNRAVYGIVSNLTKPDRNVLKRIARQ